MATHGTIAWNELLTSDPEKAKSFFAETLGWTYDSFDLETPYWVIQAGGEMIGGIGHLDSGDVKTDTSYWLTFIEVDAIDTRYKKAVELGAIEIRAPFDVPSIGRVSLLRDPTGALVGWMQSAS